jgi:localization factor PodJL
MKSGGPWNLRGLRPDTVAAAYEAARRSGVSVGEWLNELIEQSDEDGRASLRPTDHSDADYRWPDEAAQDDYGRSSRPRPPRRDHQYDDVLSEVHARLDRLTDQLEQLARGKPALRGAPAQPRRPVRLGGADPADGPVFSASQQPDLPSPATTPQLAAEQAKPGQAPEFPELEEQLRRITAQIESLRSTGLDKVIAAFRSDLADIRRQLTEALPRQAVESLCVEVEALARRVERSRERTSDADAIAGIERGLTEVLGALHGMTTAENLVGFDEALKALAQKLDLIIAREDPAALRQLETAIGALRSVVSHVASNDALNKVAEDVRSLAAKIDALAKRTATGQAVSALGDRIDTLTDAINASAEIALPRGLEKLLSDTMEKLESVRRTTDPAAFKRLEERIAQLIGRLDASDARLGNMAAVERGVSDLLAHMEQLRGAEPAPAAGASSRPAVAAIARDVAEIKRSERRTQDSLEAVHGTVEQVVGRLAMIESDIHDATLRAPRSQIATQPAAEEAEPAADNAQETATPSLAGAPTAPGEMIGAAERQDFIAAARRAAQAATAPASNDEMRSRSRRRRSRSRADGETHESKPWAMRKVLVAGAIALLTVGCLQIALHIFQDSRPAEDTAAPSQSPAEPTAPAPPRSGSAQPLGRAEPSLAATTGPTPLVAPVPSMAPSTAPNVAPSAISGAIPGAAPGGSDGGKQNAEPAATAPTVQPMAASPSNATQPAAPSAIASAAPSITPAPASAAPQLPNAADPTGSLSPRPTPSASPPPAPSNVTALNTPALSIDTLPPAIGGPALRAAAIAGEMSAQYEIAVRFGEGRGVPRDERQAAYWLDLAAKQGLAPAQFRLGSYYEKGIGVKKDLAAARDLYLAAAAKGNGKAMHNLAVLYTDGINGRPDYHTAALWFRKAADRGIIDSQYNLAILYARGSGEPQNYAEAYKWFALAAKAGDVEAANKRDDIAAQLDEATLAAADLVVKNWKPEPQPDDAVKVKAPPGGWDAAIQPPRPKPRTKSANLGGPEPNTN